MRLALPPLLLPGLLLLTSAAAPRAATEDRVPLESAIVEVTVASGSATVKRSATLPAGDAFVLPGLPNSLDREAVRVRALGGEVVSVEARDRFTRDVPEARVAEMRAHVRGLGRALELLQDEVTVLDKLEAHLDRLLRQEERDHATEVAGGRAAAETWEANFAYLSGKLLDTRRARREAGWRVEDAVEELRAAQHELGAFESTGGVHVVDLHVDVVRGPGQATLEVEYVVGNAGWTPTYDLRAASDLSSCELVYRARVWQRTGEDWRDAEVLLSTAQPRRGAQGPEPVTRWLSLREEVFLGGRMAFDDEIDVNFDVALARVQLQEIVDGKNALGVLEGAEPQSPFAQALEEGLSVRYRLARRETIESRDEPTDVLIGRATLALAPERVCVPALDTTVWLRGLARNTSDWVLLPGRASVYLGADFLGHSQVPAVQRDEDLTLHLGPDPTFSVERTPLQDLTEGPGIFGSKKTLTQRWRIRVKNAGAGGAVPVIVHEVLPKPTDERIDVEIDAVKPKLATGGRWAKEREERGVLTWILNVPPAGERVIELATETSWPEDLVLTEADRG